MRRLLIVEQKRAETANTLLVEEFGGVAANTFSVEVEKNNKIYCIACWNMSSEQHNKLKAKLYGRVSLEEHEDGRKKMKELNYKHKNKNEQVR